MQSTSVPPPAPVVQGPPIPVESVKAALQQIVQEAGGVNNSYGVANNDIGRLVRHKLNVTEYSPLQSGFPSMRKLAATCETLRVENRGRFWFLVDAQAPPAPAYVPKPKAQSNQNQQQQHFNQQQFVPQHQQQFQQQQFNNGGFIPQQQMQGGAPRPRRRAPRRRNNRNRSNNLATEGGAPPTQHQQQQQQPREPQPRRERPPMILARDLRTTPTTSVQLFTSATPGSSGLIQATFQPQTPEHSILNIPADQLNTFLHDIKQVVTEKQLLNYTLQFDHGSRNRSTPKSDQIVCRIVFDRAQFRAVFFPDAPETTTHSA
eukprot:gnl/Spiro4/16150_TR8685_c0_g1_i1.p2 gnl/Spiro4/16150_TR8685_c0_g1~~gnl/Spiro4/16150_TR8685_c0_g1_i1.p2  ORF type:complete len:318 (-),score=77.41 gnl/Spiro4/16150_TR8685_c0_g1_i1:131-1084(-)